MRRILVVAVTLALTLVAPTAHAALIRGPVNFRDAMGPEFKAGVLYRSGKLSKATSADRVVLASILAGGTIIDLRTKSKMKSSPDPRLVGVTRVPISLTPGPYYKFVKYSSRRAAIAKAIRTIAYAPGPVLIHCTYGRDRTGWVVYTLYHALGISESVARAEYLKSSGATSSKLNSGLNQAKRQYGSMARYITVGLKLTAADISALTVKLSTR